MGSANPVASNATAAGRQANRRVEVVLNEDTASQSAPGRTMQ
jgi:outer membrane protein OmpA-like peptidoglycan-associated protein